MRKKLMRYIFAACCLFAGSAHCQAGVVTFGSFSAEFVTVGDPGNTSDTNGYGAVAAAFQIMKYEVTNAQYAAFLNSVAKTNTYSLYHTKMGTSLRGGINRNGLSGAFSYAVKPNMGNKPVNFVSWFDAARYSNWLHNGATSSASTEFGAYTLLGATGGNAVAVNASATYFLPTENQWCKAAYYKGGSITAGYWDYATQSNVNPTIVTATSKGDGSAGNTGNFANFNNRADWNGLDGNVTTVGTNGRASYYGTHDMIGNVWEWNDLTGVSSPYRGIRGGGWNSIAASLSAANRQSYNPTSNINDFGFRLASLYTSTDSGDGGIGGGNDNGGDGGTGGSGDGGGGDGGGSNNDGGGSNNDGGGSNNDGGGGTGGEVPEPTSMAIFALGSLGIALRSRFRK